MEKTQLYGLINIFAAMFSSLTALLFVGFHLIRRNQRGRRLRWCLFMYMACACFNWTTAFLFFYQPPVFIHLNWLLLLSYIMVQVYFYGFVFEITRTEAGERFSPLHYVLPLALGALALAVSLITPASQRLWSVASREVYEAGQSLLYHLACNKRFEIRLLFTAVYTVLAFNRIARFKRWIPSNNTAPQPVSPRLVKISVYLSVILFVTPLVSIILSRESVIASHLLTFQVVILIVQYAFFCVIVSLHSRETSLKGPVTAEIAAETTAEVMKKTILTRQSLEEYMRSQKPFLDPDMKLNDLVEHFDINRTYISAFINNEFGVNLNTYLNNCRLAEFDRLRQLPEHSQATEAELALKAGFASYRSFRQHKEKTQS